jgi:serine/threonine protein kinase
MTCGVYYMTMGATEVLGGRYELRGVLGRGGMAEVRDGWDTRLSRAVAIKLLYPALNAQPDMRRRFEDEARSVAALSHPNIVAVYDCGDHDGTPFIVMERLPGPTLADEIARGQLQPNRVHAMLNDVLAALATAHAAGVLHRDIKPGNILLSNTGDTMKVADFGIAKTSGAAHTMTGQLVGTLAYMSPERISGAPASMADDLYAVGVMAYEALTGHRAFSQENIGALARAIMDSPPPLMNVVRPDVDPALAAVIDRAMSRDPRQRFASAEQMRSAVLGNRMAMSASAVPAGANPRPATKILVEPLAPSVTYFVPTPPRRGSASRTRKSLVAAAILAALTIGALALALNPSSPQAPEPVSTSTPVPTPTTTPPPPTTASPVVQQPDDNDNGGGNGKKGANGNRKGPKR